jgi:hypothetical protein
MFALTCASRLWRLSRSNGHPADRLREIGVDCGEPVADCAVHEPRADPEVVNDHKQGRDRAQRPQCKPRVEREHDRDDACESQQIDKDGQRASAEHLVDRVDIGGHPADQLSDRRPVEKFHRQQLDTAEKRKAKIRQAVLRDHHREIELPVKGREFTSKQGPVDESHHEQAVSSRRAEKWDEPSGRRAPPCGEENIDGEFHDVGLRERERRIERHQDEREQEQPSIGTHERPDPSDEPQVVNLTEILFSLLPHLSVMFQLLFQELALEKLGVDSPARHQLLMGSALGYLAVLEHDDVVGVAHGGGAMRYDDGRPSTHGL